MYSRGTSAVNYESPAILVSQWTVEKIFPSKAAISKFGFIALFACLDSSCALKIIAPATVGNMPSSILSSKSVVAAQNLTLAATPLASLTTKITSCQVSPTLPPGLLLDASTCSLTGAPATAIASPSLYQVKIVD